MDKNKSKIIRIHPVEDGFWIRSELPLLSRKQCLRAAEAFLRGVQHEKSAPSAETLSFRGMDAMRIAQELWSHALAYYVGSTLRKRFRKRKLIEKTLGKIAHHAEVVNVNYNDPMAWAYRWIWRSAAVHVRILRRLFRRARWIRFVQTDL